MFLPEKHRPFNDIINDSSHSRIEIKRFRSGDNNNDIIVNDLSSVKKTELNFERKILQSKIFTIEQVINECAIYDIADVTSLVYNLQTEVEHEKDGKLLRIRKGIIKDETESIEIVLFSLLVDEVSNNTSYDLKKMRVQKLMNDRILKSTETTKVSKNDDVAIFVRQTLVEMLLSSFPVAYVSMRPAVIVDYLLYFHLLYFIYK